MVFSEMLNDIFGNKNPSNEKINKKALNVLEQGVNHLLKKRKQMNENQIGNLMEGFQTPKALREATKKELDVLKQMEAEYNTNISAYATEYKNFMKNYYVARDNKINCMKNCMVSHKGTGAQQTRLRESCIGGCQIKGPYVVQCQDSYKGFFQDTTKKCKQLTSGKCLRGSIEPGQVTAMNSSSYRDINSVTLADGCCACGGGYGGKPKANVRGKNISNCNDIYNAFALLKGDSRSKPLINACLTANYKNENRSAQMYLEYNRLKEKNKILMTQAQNIYSKINQLKDVNVGIKGILTKEEKYFKDQIDKFSSIYSELLGLDRSGKTQNITFSAQEEDMILKEQSSEIRYYAWIILALLVSSFTLKKLYQKN